ncbi:MAG TPA: NAD(P)/FAD-dependent oxidoreductase [Ktedonobacterales bacterium]|nr:NAD(P)/FAD-dependent oxidoreductase [Ktedonobacterales bacterium]
MRVIILGGGPAGVTAALQARELQAEVTLIESKRVGGTSINEGPAPVRTLARAARLLRDSRSWDTFGLWGMPPQVDLAAVLANARRVAEYAHDKKHLAATLQRTGIDVVEGGGPATCIDALTVGLADGRRWQGDRIIIAVGGRERILPLPGAEFALTYSDLWSLQRLPARVAVVGGAATGCQLASILTDFGCQVTVLELAPRLVPQEDADVSHLLEAMFRQKGMTILTRAATAALERTEQGIRLTYQQDETPGELVLDAVFFAVGWPGNVDTLNLEAAGVRVERGFIPVNDFLQTTVPHIFAAGDINGQSMLVQSARTEGRIAAENALLGPFRRFTHDIVPTGSFTDPEYGSVGLTEEEARKHYDCLVAVARYEDLLRPIADARPEGFCKLIVERQHRYILGAHVLGEYSAEIVQMVAACMAGNMRIEEVADLQLAYPTVTEGVGMAAQKIVRALGVAPMPHLWMTLVS